MPILKYNMMGARVQVAVQLNILYTITHILTCLLLGDEEILAPTFLSSLFNTIRMELSVELINVMVPRVMRMYRRRRRL